MPLAIRSFQKAVTTAGTPVQLIATPTYVKWVRITAKCAAATSFMYIGNNGSNTVSAALGDAILHAGSVVLGDILSSGHTETIDLSTFYVDADVSLDKVTVSYLLET